MKAKKGLALFLSLAMTLSLLSMPTLAANYNDAADSWAASSIERWSASGVVKGDSNGNFNPDAKLSRAELAQIFTNMFGLTEKAENTFADLRGDEWYADAVLKCAAAGIMKGDGVNANAEKPISRQETVVMFGRAVGVTPAAEPDMSKFTDADEVADWAAGYMAPLVEMGILSGGGDGTIAAGDTIDRASTVALLDKAVAEYVSEPGEVAVDNAKGFVIVNVPAEAGEVVLTGSAAGVVVAAGTADTKVVAKDLTADTVKVDGAAAVSVEGKSEVGTVAVNAAAEVAVAQTAKADTVEVTGADAKVSVAGTVGSVSATAEAEGAALTIEKGAKVESVVNDAPKAEVAVNASVKNVENGANAADSTVSVGKGATVDTLKTDAPVKVDNQGTVKQAEVNTGNVVIDGNKPTQTVVPETVEPPKDSTGKELPTVTPEEAEKPSSKPSGGGDVYVPTVSVWDGTSVETGWYSESSNAFTLSTAAQLAGLAKLVNEGKTFAGKTVSLGIDMDLNGKAWTPIGNGTRGDLTTPHFSGSFNGGGHKVTGLINSGYMPAHTDDNEYSFGLFGYVKNAAIQNLTVSGAAIDTNVTIDGTALVGDAVSALIGFSSGGLTLSNCSVMDSTIKGKDGIGGLVGRAYGTDALNETVTLQDCSSSATVESSGKSGGICGIASNGIESVVTDTCINSGHVSGTITGGVFGYLNAPSEVSDCTNSGEIDATSGTSAGIGYAGGITGVLFNQAASSAFTRCSNSGSVSGDKYTGGMIGYCNENLSGVLLDSCLNSGSIVSKHDIAGGISGSFVGTMDACVNSGSVSGAGAVGGMAGHVVHKTNSVVSSFQNCKSGAASLTASTVQSGNLQETSPFDTYAWTGQIVGLLNSNAAIAVADEGTARPTVAAIAQAGVKLNVTAGNLAGEPASRGDRSPEISIYPGAGWSGKADPLGIWTYSGTNGGWIKKDTTLTVDGMSYVFTTEALKTAVAGENDIGLGANIEISEPIVIARDLTIDGLEHTIKTTNNEAKSAVFAMNDTLPENAVVTLCNMKIVGSDTATRGCSVSMLGTNGLTLNMDRCEASANYYTVFIDENNTNIEVNLSACDISGWSAIRSMSNHAKVNVTDSTLTGINNKPYTEVGDNDFGTLIVNYVSENIWNLQNTDIISESPSGNIQLLIDIRSGDDNTVTVDSDCTMTLRNHAKPDHQPYYYNVESGTSILSVGNATYQFSDLSPDINFDLVYDESMQTLSITPTEGRYLYYFVEEYGNESYNWIAPLVLPRTSIENVTKSANHVSFIAAVYQWSEDGKTRSWAGNVSLLPNEP